MSAPAAAMPVPDGEQDARERPGSRARRIWGWVAVVAIAVVLGGSLVLAGGNAWSPREELDPESAGPEGSRALTEILRDRGVDVEVTRDLEATREAVGANTTLVMPDPQVIGPERISELLGSTGDAVILSPSSWTVRQVFPASGIAGYGSSERARPVCDVPAVRRAGQIVPGVLYEPAPAATGCYPGDGGYALLLDEGGGERTALVDGAELFTNEHLAENGNAALALNLMGRHDTLVWYMPALSDAPQDAQQAPPSLGELTPPWVTPAILLLIVAAVAAAVWRGRRFGPLVAENLPVTVRASETLEGRARLYARAHDTGHAAAAIRDGAAKRIARRLGLARTATPAQIADAAAGRIGARPETVRGILLTLPDSDAALASWGARLRDLETAVDTAVRTERNTP